MSGTGSSTGTGCASIRSRPRKISPCSSGTCQRTRPSKVSGSSALGSVQVIPPSVDSNASGVPEIATRGSTAGVASQECSSAPVDSTAEVVAATPVSLTLRPGLALSRPFAWSDRRTCSAQSSRSKVAPGWATTISSKYPFDQYAAVGLNVNA